MGCRSNTPFLFSLPYSQSPAKYQQPFPHSPHSSPPCFAYHSAHEGCNNEDWHPYNQSPYRMQHSDSTDYLDCSRRTTSCDRLSRISFQHPNAWLGDGEEQYEATPDLQVVPYRNGPPISTDWNWIRICWISSRDWKTVSVRYHLKVRSCFVLFLSVALPSVWVLKRYS